MSNFELIEKLAIEDYDFDLGDMNVNFFSSSKFLLYSALKGEFHQKPVLNYSLFIFDLFMRKCKNKNYHENKILFFAYTGNQIKNLLPIYEEINKTEKSCIILKQSHVHNKLKKSIFGKNVSIYNEINLDAINYELLQKYSTLDSIKIALQFLKWSLSKKKKIIEDLRRLSEQFNCPGRERYLFNLISSSYFYNIFLLSAFKNYLVNSNTKVIVLGNEFTMLGNLTIMLAKSLNIKTLYIPHSIITGHPVYEQIHSDKVVLQGQHDYDLLKYESNVPADKLVVTGRPFIEQRLIKYSKGKKNTGTKTICLATQPLPVKIEFVKDIIDELRNINNSHIKIVIKPHPSEKPTDYEQLETINVEVSKENDLFEVLSTSDLVMTINSNAAAEAAFLGLPALSYNPWQLHKPIYVKKGIIEEIVNKEDILIKVEEMLFNRTAINNYEKRAEEYTRYMNHKIDGKSKERIVSVIKSLISEYS